MSFQFGHARNSSNDVDDSLIPALLVVAAVLGVVAVVLFSLARPPTVDEIEEDIWATWLSYANDAQDRTLADLLVADERAPAKGVCETLCEILFKDGKRFLIPTEVRYLAVRRIGDAKDFAVWRSPTLPPEWVFHAERRVEEDNWKNRILPLHDPRTGGPLGELQVSYQFYHNYAGGLDFLPRVRQLRLQDRWLFWLVAGLCTVILLAVLANFFRLRERAARVRSQQVTLDLARQMCHELRNGLWAFSLEGKNLHHFFQTVDDYLKAEPAAFIAGAEEVGMEPRQSQRLRRAAARRLAEVGADPVSDVLSSQNLARESYGNIEGFARYLQLTVEELDRHLLGRAGGWEPTALRVTDAWSQACQILVIRLRSTGVQLVHGSDAGDALVWIDGRELIHVFVNLIKNAVEAMHGVPAPRELQFSAVSEHDRVVCRLHNPGPAIDSASLPRLFERGFSTKPGGGRGTGLSLVKEVVERAGGSIAVDSVAGEGTTFVLSFPQHHSDGRAEIEE